MASLGMRLMSRRLRAHMARGERLLEHDVGALPDGTTAALLASDRALYVCTTRGRQFEASRISLAAIGSLLDAGALDLATSDERRMTVAAGGGTTGAVREAARRRLLAMPGYRRDSVVDDSTFTVSYRPWRPGARASWIVEAPPGSAGHEEEAAELVESAEREVEALAADPAGPAPDGVVLTPLSAEAVVADARAAWAHELGVRPADVLLTRRAGEAARSPRVTFLVLDEARVWLAEADLAAMEHPRLHSVPLDQVRVVRADGGDCVEVGAGRPEDRRVPGAAEDLAGWRERLRALKD
ncbi:hypothetical protein [Phaeacidiphilus oryzae]|uniref:hypothetical protein n=1 Tax=Phaeacidiphilus oryzae TaxID=348818 RepID=UPI000A648E9A|nr:hypothetical protein [Phaeacidiphilus oryzae]